MRRVMLATVALAVAVALSPLPPDGVVAPGSLPACKGESDCISSAGRESPNHFQAPLSFAPTQRRVAFAAAVGALRAEGCGVVDDSQTYIAATCSGDDVELLLREDVATFRVAARQKGVTPPWCVEKGCINGSMNQRRRVRPRPKLTNGFVEKRAPAAGGCSRSRRRWAGRRSTRRTWRTNRDGRRSSSTPTPCRGRSDAGNYSTEARGLGLTRSRSRPPSGPRGPGARRSRRASARSRRGSRLRLAGRSRRSRRGPCGAIGPS